jgi:hypothetical protein
MIAYISVVNPEDIEKGPVVISVITSHNNSPKQQ